MREREMEANSREQYAICLGKNRNLKLKQDMF